MACMFLVERLTGRVDTSLLLGSDLRVSAWAIYDMAGWTPDVSRSRITMTGLLQGTGLRLRFVPLTTITFATLVAEMSGDETGINNLSHDIGSSPRST